MILSARWKPFVKVVGRMLQQECLPNIIYFFTLFTCITSTMKNMSVYHHIKPSWIFHFIQPCGWIIVSQMLIWPRGHGSSMESVTQTVWLVCRKIFNCGVILPSYFRWHGDEERVKFSLVLCHMWSLMFQIHQLVTDVVKNTTITFLKT